MVSKVNSLFTLLVFFNLLFLVLVLGDSPSAGTPTPPPALAPKPSFSAPASAPTAPPLCNCSLEPKTVVACSVVLLQGGTPGLPRYICCRGLLRLKVEDVYSCLCYVVLKTNLTNEPLAKLTVPAAMKIVSVACRL